MNQIKGQRKPHVKKMLLRRLPDLDPQSRLVVLAIAAAMTEDYDTQDEPFTEVQVLEHAQLEGLLAMERRYLGTRSLDPSCARPGSDTPRQTPVMRAMLRMLSEKYGVRS